MNRISFISRCLTIGSLGLVLVTAAAADELRAVAAATAQTAPNLVGATLFPVGPADYAEWAACERATLAIPLPGAAPLTVEWKRFDVLAEDVVLRVVTADGERPLARPTVVCFSGRADDPRVRAYLGVSPTGVCGFVETPAASYIISSGPADERRPTLIYEPAALPAGSIQWADFQCALDELFVPAADWMSGDGGIAGAPPCRRLNIAIETDYEFTSVRFGGSSSAASNYIALLFGAVTEIYTRDVNTRLLVSYLRLWTTPNDPWDATNTGSQLEQFRSYWVQNMSGVLRKLAHFLSGRALGGGVAYLGQLCSYGQGYGLSANMNGYFPYPIQNNNAQNWDLMVVSHEIGHNFGAPHTHCMSPPVDTCAGPNYDCPNPQVCVVGSLMSYCHLCSGGMANVRMEFHSRTINEAILPYLDWPSTCDIIAAVGVAQSPQSETVAAGATIELVCFASGVGPVSYQWRRNGVLLSDDGHFMNASYYRMTIVSAQPADSASYDCVVSNFCSSAVSNPASLVVCAGPPGVTQPPADHTVAGGATVQFSVQATGVGVLSYQWRHNGAPISDGARISGATTAMLTIANVQVPDAGGYAVMLTDACGSSLSPAATLSVSPPVMIGDCNCDGIVDNFDIDPFVTALTQPAAYATLYPNCSIAHADINGDGTVDNFDIDGFVALLTGP